MAAALGDLGQGDLGQEPRSQRAAELEPNISGVSWAAVAAGAAANLAATLFVLSLGVGLGLTVVSPWGGSTQATTFKLGVGLFFIVLAMIGASIGGYIAGRLRTKWTGVHSDEVYFRDTAHGFLSWAFAAIVGFVLLSAPAAQLLDAGGSKGAPAAADRYVRALLQQPDGAGQNVAQDAAALDRNRSLLTSPIAGALASGGALADPDRAFVQGIVASTGLSPADAGKRVDDVVGRMQSDLDQARKTAAHLALWLAAAMLLGAFCASLAATEGGGLRDGTWGRARRDI